MLYEKLKLVETLENIHFGKGTASDYYFLQSEYNRRYYVTASEKGLIVKSLTSTDYILLRNHSKVAKAYEMHKDEFGENLGFLLSINEYFPDQFLILKDGQFKNRDSSDEIIWHIQNVIEKATIYNIR